METTEKSILRAHWVKIIDNLDPGDIVNQLFQDGVLEQDDIDKIRSKNIRSEKCVALLKILMRRGPERKPFEYFLNSLHEKYEYLHQSIIDSCDSIYDENFTQIPCEHDDRNVSRLNGSQENTWIENLKEPVHANSHAFESWCEIDFANPVCQNTNIRVKDLARQTELKSTGEQVVVSGTNEISQNFDKTKQEPEQMISPLMKITKTVIHTILNILTSFAFVRIVNMCVSILSIINACIVVLCLFMCIVLIPFAITAEVLAFAGMLLIKIQRSGLKMTFKLIKISSSYVFKMLGNTLCMLCHYNMANTGISCFRMFRMSLDKAVKLILRIMCIVSMCLYSAVLMAIIIAILSAGTSRKGVHRLMSHCLDILKFIRKSVLSFIACAIQSMSKSISASYKWVFDKTIGLWLWFMFSKSIRASYKWVFDKTIGLLLWFMFSFFVYGTKEKGLTTQIHHLSVKECVILFFGATFVASIVFLKSFVDTVAIIGIFITGSLVVAFLLIRDRRNDMTIGYKPRCA